MEKSLTVESSAATDVDQDKELDSVGNSVDELMEDSESDRV